MQYIILALLVILTFSGAARADCEDPGGAEGVIIYNADYKTMQFCNGTAWISMSSILPTGMPKSPSFYMTEDQFNGSEAGDACDSGYHMCFVTGMFGRTLVPETGFSNFLNQPAWVDSQYPGYSCGDWTSTSGNGFAARLNNTINSSIGDAWQGGYQSCSSDRRVLCCSD